MKLRHLTFQMTIIWHTKLNFPSSWLICHLFLMFVELLLHFEHSITNINQLGILAQCFMAEIKLGSVNWERYLTCRFLSPLQLSDGRTFQVKTRFDTEVELTYFRHGGILNYMIRRMLWSSQSATNPTNPQYVRTIPL